MVQVGPTQLQGSLQKRELENSESGRGTQGLGDRGGLRLEDAEPPAAGQDLEWVLL